tara:strand:+ start:4055 stop:4957 length:903 start_codon:yes stop_codon:yes gene_type:complete
MKNICVICPVFNEEKTIDHFYKEFLKFTKKIKDFKITLLFSNNASVDKSLEKIVKLNTKDRNVRYITLSRNFGYQNSILASLSAIEADAYIIIDCDCEDPPSLIPEFISGFREGHDLVYGKRDRREESKFITFLRKIFYRVTYFCADNEFIIDMAEFSLISKRIRDVVIDNNTNFPFIRSEFAYAGFSRKEITYNRQKRSYGNSNYNLFGMTKFAVAGFLTTTTFPLRLIFYFFLIVNCLNLYYLMFVSDHNVFFNIIVFINLLFISLSLSILGMYIARIYNNSLSRKNFIVDYKKSYLG